VSSAGTAEELAIGAYRRGSGTKNDKPNKVDTVKIALDRQVLAGPPCSIGNAQHKSAFHTFAGPTTSSMPPNDPSSADAATSGRPGSVPCAEADRNMPHLDGRHSLISNAKDVPKPGSASSSISSNRISCSSVRQGHNCAAVLKLWTSSNRISRGSLHKVTGSMKLPIKKGKHMLQVQAQQMWMSLVQCLPVQLICSRQETLPYLTSIDLWMEKPGRYFIWPARWVYGLMSLKRLLNGLRCSTRDSMEQAALHTFSLKITVSLNYYHMTLIMSL